MKSITKSQMEWLIKNGYLQVKTGKYEDLIVTSRKHGKGHKDRYVSEPVYNHLSEMK